MKRMQTTQKYTMAVKEHFKCERLTLQMRNLEEFQFNFYLK